MIILNKNKDKVNLDLKQYEEMIPCVFNATDIITNTKLIANKTLEVAPKSGLILEIQ